MNEVLVNILEEEYQRVLIRISFFTEEISKCPKGYLAISKIHGDEYLYRKYRDGEKIISEYIGKIGSDKANKAFDQRVKYLKLKGSLKDLEEQEQDLRKVLSIYARRKKATTTAKNV